MKTLSRRDMLKTGLLAPAAAAAAQRMSPMAVAMQVAAAAPSPTPEPTPYAAGMPGAVRERLLLDFGFRFHFGHATDTAKDLGFNLSFQKTGNFIAAGSMAFNDSDWSAVDLPHDWAIDLPYENDPALTPKGSFPLGRAYPATSVGWYRRVFDLPAEDKGKRISIEFDGSYRESMVVFNGYYIGRHSGGYDPFRFDVTDFVNYGNRNVLLVRVDATSSDGWFYEGAGIYRHVWLTKTSPLHVRQWGTFVNAEVHAGKASLSIRTEVSNESHERRDVRVLSAIIDPSGRQVERSPSAALAIAAAGEQVFTQQIQVDRPQLWSLEERNLYKLITEVEADGKVVDRYETPFGIRTIFFDAGKGFLLNGKPVKIKGTCNHQDHAGVGVAVPDAVHRYRVHMLQEMGSNAIRTSHNPPTPELLDACDELGMLVFDETRMMSSNPEGLSQFSNLIRRDRNHPCVFMWSMGNEEGQANTENGVHILTAMKAVATALDGTRPVSIAPVGAIGVGGLAECDVMGYNYMDPAAEAYHRAHPTIPVVGTETVSAVGTRGIYITDKSKGFVGSYDPYTTSGRASAEGWWSFCNARPWLSGGFIWTGFDYRGEPSPNGWPNISSQYGIVDTCGFPKDTYYYYQSWWTSRPVLHLFPHWNWPGMEGKEIAVWVYTNLDSVELFLNGQSLGAKQTKKDSHLAWIVPYSPGTIEARGSKNGTPPMIARRETTGAASKLVMRADREQLFADGEDVAMFAVEIQDAQGRVLPITDSEVTFKISGAGKLIGTGNGDPTDHAPAKSSSRKAFSGLCMALVQALKTSGSITVEASSPGLASASVTIPVKSTQLRPQVPVWTREVLTGAGVTGLWRPIPAAGAGAGMMAMLLGDSSLVFTLRQQGSNLSGTVEGVNGGFISGIDIPSPVLEGKVDGTSVSFKSGNSTFTGTVKGDRIELQRQIHFPFGLPSVQPSIGPRPAIGPPPDGSDPSIDMSHMPAGLPLILQRVES